MTTYSACILCPHCQASKAGMQGHSLIQTNKGVRAPLVCPHCGEIVIVGIQLSSDYSRIHWRGDESFNLDSQTSRVKRTWTQYPKEIIRDVPANVPDKIGRCYQEAVDNKERGNFETAILLCGKALDLATKSMDQAWKLEKRLKKLAEEGKITKDMSDWAEEIRLDRNTAIHEEHDFDESTAETIITFTEAFLTYTFTLPALVQSRRPTP